MRNQGYYNKEYYKAYKKYNDTVKNSDLANPPSITKHL